LPCYSVPHENKGTGTGIYVLSLSGTRLSSTEKVQSNNNNNFIIIMTRIFKIFTGIDLQIKLKMLDYNNSVNPHVA